MEITGSIKVLGSTQTFGANNFRKRELVVETNEQYPQTIMVEFMQNATDLLDSFKIGDEVLIGINLRGREWVNPQGETKYFNSIQGWRIQLVGASAVQNKSSQASDNFDDDLPF